MPESDPIYILSINCGSSSIKSKLYRLDKRNGSTSKLCSVADVTVKNITSAGKKVEIQVEWVSEDGKEPMGQNVKEEGEDGDKVDCERQNMGQNLKSDQQWSYG